MPLPHFVILQSLAEQKQQHHKMKWKNYTLRKPHLLLSQDKIENQKTKKKMNYIEETLWNELNEIEMEYHPNETSEQSQRLSAGIKQKQPSQSE